MKRNLLGLILVSALSSSCMLASEPYVSVNYGVVSSGDNKIFGFQPVGELVGDSGSQIELRLGLSNFENNNEQSRAFLYAWNNSEKNDELGIGIGGEWIMHPFDNKSIGLVIGGQAGVGYQAVAGSEVTLSTNLNKVTYVIGSSNLTPTVAEFEDDTYVIDIALTLGTTYKFTDNLMIDLAYVYKYDAYQVSYRNKDSATILNQMSFEQDNHMIRTGLTYRF